MLMIVTLRFRQQKSFKMLLGMVKMYKLKMVKMF